MGLGPTPADTGPTARCMRARCPVTAAPGLEGVDGTAQGCLGDPLLGHRWEARCQADLDGCARAVVRQRGSPTGTLHPILLRLRRGLRGLRARTVGRIEGENGANALILFRPA